MPEFLVETYVARDDPGTAREHAERSERAAAELSGDGRDVRCVRSIYVPEDETCFLLFEAPTIETVHEAIDRAGLRCEHVSAASSPGGPRPRAGR